MNEKVRCQIVIQARMGSTRLPGKVLKDLAGKPVLSHVVFRCSLASMIDRVIVATSTNKEDDQIEKWCRDNNIPCIRGSSEDVLSRYVMAAKEFPCENIVRITADCPLIDPGVIDQVVSKHIDEELEYTSNVLERSFPTGYDLEVISNAALEKIDKLSDTKPHREHVTLYIRENVKKFKTGNVRFGASNEHLRLTLDQPEDYQVFQEIYKKLPENSIVPSIYEILYILEKYPEIAQINSKYESYVKVKKTKNN